jgi:hypothetical protein
VRRRCNSIVVVDAGADGDLWFEDLGNAIRKCATDLHIEIEIDVSNLERLQPSEFSRAYCVVGKILYERTDLGASNGTLLYIKPVLLGNERADLKNYRKANKDFPHQSTVDQWFDETQFESYRSLGYRVGSIVFDKLFPEDQQSPSGTDGAPVKGPDDALATLAEAIQKKWGVPEPVTEA